MRCVRRSAIVFVLLFVLTLSAASAASAGNRLWNPWGTNGTQAVGQTCGNRYGNYARSVQMMMWAGHFYNDMNGGRVDGNFGPATHNAVYRFQQWHGNHLLWDGCVGYNTWQALWSTNYYTGYDWGWGGQYNYYWQKGHPELIGNHWVSCPNGFLFDWFDGQYWIESGWNGSSGPPTCAPGP